MIWLLTNQTDWVSTGWTVGWVEFSRSSSRLHMRRCIKYKIGNWSMFTKNGIHWIWKSGKAKSGKLKPPYYCNKMHFLAIASKLLKGPFLYIGEVGTREMPALVSHFCWREEGFSTPKLVDPSYLTKELLWNCSLPLDAAYSATRRLHPTFHMKSISIAWPFVAAKLLLHFWPGSETILTLARDQYNHPNLSNVGFLTSKLLLLGNEGKNRKRQIICWRPFHRLLYPTVLLILRGIRKEKKKSKIPHDGV